MTFVILFKKQTTIYLEKLKLNSILKTHKK